MDWSTRSGGRPRKSGCVIAAVRSMSPANAPARVMIVYGPGLAGASMAAAAPTLARPRSHPPRRLAGEQLFAADQEQQQGEERERDQREQIGGLAREERVVRAGPVADRAVELGEHAGEERDDDPGDRAAGDVA